MDAVSTLFRLRRWSQQRYTCRRGRKRSVALINDAVHTQKEPHQSIVIINDFVEVEAAKHSCARSELLLLDTEGNYKRDDRNGVGLEELYVLSSNHKLLTQCIEVIKGLIKRGFVNASGSLDHVFKTAEDIVGISRMTLEALWFDWCQENSP